MSYVYVLRSRLYQYGASVNLVAPPQRPRLDAALTCSDCHRYALHPRSPTDIPGVRIGVLRIRTTEQTVPVRSSTERGTRVRVDTVHVPIHVPVLNRPSTNFCTVADIDDIIDRSDALLRSPRPIQVARPIYSAIVVSDRSTRRSVDLSALTPPD